MKRKSRFMRTITILLLLSINLFPQAWQLNWTSPKINYSAYSGFLDFAKNGDEWESRFYTLDSINFSIMDGNYSTTPQYTYAFSDAERLAGLQLYSLQQDLNNDSKTDFYVLSYYGISTNYRQAVKIFDITTGAVILELNSANYYYSYPTLYDLNTDGTLECVITRYEYPNFAQYDQLVYNTGVSGVSANPTPLNFTMEQNFPNPFNPSTTIQFSITNNSRVKINIYSTNGELVNSILNEELPVGEHKVVWDGTNLKGTRVPTGVYFYQLVVNQRSETKKMLLLQ